MDRPGSVHLHHHGFHRRTSWGVLQPAEQMAYRVQNETCELQKEVCQVKGYPRYSSILLFIFVMFSFVFLYAEEPAFKLDID